MSLRREKKRKYYQKKKKKKQEIKKKRNGRRGEKEILKSRYCDVLSFYINIGAIYISFPKIAHSSALRSRPLRTTELRWKQRVLVFLFTHTSTINIFSLYGGDGNTGTAEPADEKGHAWALLMDAASNV